MKLTFPTASLLVGLLLTACSNTTVAELPTPLATRTAEPTVTIQPSATPTQPPTATLTATPTQTATPTLTATPTATPIPPTPTILVVTAQPRPATPTTIRQAVTGEHLFPIRQVRAASYGPCHHDYPASDIFVPIGSDFVAVTDGVVEFVTYTDEWSPRNDDPAIRGGLSVAIVGTDGVRYYGSHLSAIVDGIAPGVQVVAGQPLGKTGKSGNAAGTPPHLHFGISPPTTPDDWQTRRGTINPVPYLNAWKTGKNVTPDLDRIGGGAC